MQEQKLPTERMALVEMAINKVAFHFPDRVYLQNFSFKEGIDLTNEAKFTLFDPDWDYLESLIFKESIPSVRFRFGWQGQMSQWVEKGISSYTPTFSPNGVTLEVVCGALSKNEGNTVVEIFEKEGTKISDVVLGIARSNKWKTPIVEPTRDFLNCPTVSPMISPIAYIKTYLLPKAKNMMGDTSYKFFQDRDSVWHFHTSKYEPGRKSYPAKKSVYKHYTVARDQRGEMLSFSPTNLPGPIFALGGFWIEGKSIDIEEKEELSLPVSATENSGDQIKLGDRNPRFLDQGKRGRVMFKPTRSKDEFETITKSRYSYYKDMMYAATGSLIGDPNLLPGCVIRVSILKKSMQEHYLSGLYQVHTVIHDISGGSFKSDIECLKDEISIGDVISDSKKVKYKDKVETQGTIFKTSLAENSLMR